MKQFLLPSLLIFFLLPGSYGQSVQIGSSNYIKLSNNASLQLKAFTLEAWIQPLGTGLTSSSGNGSNTAVPIITKGRGEADAPSNLNVNYFLGINAQKKLTADFEQSSGTNRFISSQTSIQDGTWTHVAVSYEPVSAVWKLYINGALDTTKDMGSNITPAYQSIQPAAIGSALNSKGTPQGFFNGKIDEVRIWKIARSSADVLNNYKKELITGTGLVARFGMNEGAGTVAINSITGSSEGTLINSPQWANDFNNSAPNTPVNTSPANGALLSSASTTLCVTANDRNRDKLRVQFYGRKKRSREKFTIVLLPDTQFYTAEKQGTNGGTNALFKSQTNWIANNAAGRNIVYVGHLGDCVQNGDNYEVEWRRADTAFKIIESANGNGTTQGIPYGICVGNHDQTPFGDANGTTLFYNKYFGTSRFSNKPYYGGHSGTNNDNHYQMFTAGTLDFLVICPEYNQASSFSAEGGTLDWMEDLVKKYPQRKVIVLSHYLLTIDALFTTQGKAIYNRLKIYPNLILMMGGHITQRDGEAKRTDTYNGNTVQTIASDYQTRTLGGNGLLRTLEFDPPNNKVAIQTYSPYTNTYETDSNSQFNLIVNLNSAPKSFALIGEVGNLAPGSSACVNWTSLETDTDFEWYAKVFDGEKTVNGTSWLFTTPSTNTTNSNNKSEAVIAQEISSNESFNIFPIPNNTRYLTFSFAEKITGKLIIEFFDASGTLHLKKSYKDVGNRISFEHQLSSGTYTVLVTTEHRKEAKKILILK